MKSDPHSGAPEAEQDATLTRKVPIPPSEINDKAPNLPDEYADHSLNLGDETLLQLGGFIITFHILLEPIHYNLP